MLLRYPRAHNAGKKRKGPSSQVEGIIATANRTGQRGFIMLSLSRCADIAPPAGGGHRAIGRADILVLAILGHDER